MLKRRDIKFEFVQADYWHHKDLDILRDLVDAGKIRPHVDKTYDFKDLVAKFHALADWATNHESVKMQCSLTWACPSWCGNSYLTTYNLFPPWVELHSNEYSPEYFCIGFPNSPH